jgi:transcriptional regulator
MYCPNHFREDRLEALHGFIARHPLATLVTSVDARPDANHVPVLLDRARGTFGALRGHVARANPVWRTIADNSEVLVLFHGADAYVSPSSYPSKRTDGRVVPTWNYAVVHARGHIRWIHHHDRLHEVVRTLTDEHEAARDAPWAVTDAPASYIDGMLKAIVGFEIELTELEGKIKASQNKSDIDRAGVRTALHDTHDPEAVDELVRAPAPCGPLRTVGS